MRSTRFIARARGFVAAACVFVLASCSSGLEKADNVSVAIVDYGIFETLETEKGKVADFRMAQTTDTVPFVPGTTYGLLFKIDGEPPGAEIQVKLQWAITPATVTGKRRLARLSQPRYRNVTIGKYGIISSTIGNQSYRRPYKDLMFVTDMNGKVLARREFTIVDAETADDRAGDSNAE